MSENLDPTFNERRPCIAVLDINVKMGPNAQSAFTQACRKQGQSAIYELCSESGMLQNRLQRFMWDEGMTADVGLGASLLFTQVSATGFSGQIYLHSDLTDEAGFYADFDAMINGLRCRCWDKAFELSWRPSFVADAAKQHIAHFVGAAHV